MTSCLTTWSACSLFPKAMYTVNTGSKQPKDMYKYSAKTGTPCSLLMWGDRTAIVTTHCNEEVPQRFFQLFFAAQQTWEGTELFPCKQSLQTNNVKNINRGEMYQGDLRNHERSPGSSSSLPGLSGSVFCGGLLSLLDSSSACKMRRWRRSTWKLNQHLQDDCRARWAAWYTHFCDTTTWKTVNED